MSNERELPLFPLSAVLFPASYMPIQVFEERYKEMLADVSKADDAFGIALIKSGSEVGGPAETYRIGTTVKIVQRAPVSDGRTFISVFGQQRFAIKEILRKYPYVIARVELLNEGARDDVSSQLVGEVREKITSYVQVVMGLRGGWVRGIEAPEDPLALSYFVGGTLSIGPMEKQKLLEAQPMAYRLILESEILDREISTLRETLAGKQGLTKRFNWS